jgi:hypothetical protein
MGYQQLTSTQARCLLKGNDNNMMSGYATYILRKKFNKQKRIFKNKQYIAEYKRKHPCTQCGERDIDKLTFHHKNPLSKKEDVATMMGKRPLESLKKEIAKCEVMCYDCHTEWHRRIQFKMYEKIYRHRRQNSAHKFVNKNGIECVTNQAIVNKKGIMQDVRCGDFKQLYSELKKGGSKNE